MAHQKNFRFFQEMNLRVIRHDLLFRKPARTSRNTLNSRTVFYVLMDSEDGAYTGIGECAPIDGLSTESTAEVEQVLRRIAEKHAQDDIAQAIAGYSSIRFAFESAMLDLINGGKRILFPGMTGIRIPVNGLVWMGDREGMLSEAREKIAAGYKTIKLKIGGIRFDEELEILAALRKEFPESQLTIRLDANGAFSAEEALEKLYHLSEFGIHSIEQPIRAGFWHEMALIVHKSTIPVALDEELIGVHELSRKEDLLDTIRPAYLILKPQLHGGFSGCDEWIALAVARGIGWWATSALESNIGLNAIAQWVATKNNPLPQGLGTGMLYTNNIPSPLRTENGEFFWETGLRWDLPGMF
jgi:O-succinylbenzoate synthase